MVDVFLLAHTLSTLFVGGGKHRLRIEIDSKRGVLFIYFC